MDKIITLIIVYYLFKSLFRFLSGEQGKNKGTTRQPPIPPHRPTPSPPIKSETRSAPRPDFPSSWREVGQVLTDLKRQANEQKGIKIPHETPHQQLRITQHIKKEKDDQEDQSPAQKQMPPKGHIKETSSPDMTKIVQEDKIERDYISFDQPGLFLQGIILSEILRPPMAMRNHLVPPYLRG